MRESICVAKTIKQEAETKLIREIAEIIAKRVMTRVRAHKLEAPEVAEASAPEAVSVIERRNRPNLNAK